MANVLGLDLGGKAVGVAIVEQPENRVLWCGTLHLSDKIKDLYDQRRVLRRARRTRKRYRKPKVPQRGGGAGGTGERGTYLYKKAKGLNQSLRTNCKYVDPDTGHVCGKNTPKLANVSSMRNGHRFKVPNFGGTCVNQAIIVYRRQDGKLASYPVKNPRAFGPTPRPSDFAKVFWRFGPGDSVADLSGKPLGRIIKSAVRKDAAINEIHTDNHNGLLDHVVGHTACVRPRRRH